MAINVNNKSQSIERKLYTGLTFVNWVAINPTLDELKVLLGTDKLDKEPEYLSTNDNGNKRVQLDFWLKNDKVTTKMTLWLENESFKSEKGKTLFLNNVGQVTWSDSLEILEGNDKMKWFTKFSPIKECKRGVNQLMDFIITLGNLDTNSDDAEVSLDKVDNLFNGDYSELKELLKGFESSKVGVLLGVKDGKYQVVWTNSYKNTFVKDGKNFSKQQLEALQGEYAWKQDFSLEFKEYVPNLSTEDTLDKNHKATESLFSTPIVADTVFNPADLGV